MLINGTRSDTRNRFILPLLFWYSEIDGLIFYWKKIEEIKINLWIYFFFGAWSSKSLGTHNYHKFISNGRSLAGDLGNRGQFSVNNRNSLFTTWNTENTLINSLFCAYEESSTVVFQIWTGSSTSSSAPFLVVYCCPGKCTCFIRLPPTNHDKPLYTTLTELIRLDSIKKGPIVRVMRVNLGYFIYCNKWHGTA